MVAIPESASKRHCIFCGGDGTTREHILSDWLPDEVADAGADFCFVRTFDLPRDPASMFRPEAIRDGHRVPNRDHVIKAVCKTCNGGWMSEIEGAVAPLLRPYLRMQVHGFAVDTVQALWLARWAYVKTLCILWRTSYQPEQEDYYAAHERCFPPSHVAVDMLISRHFDNTIHYYCLGCNDKGYVVLLKIGRLYFRVSHMPAEATYAFCRLCERSTWISAPGHEECRPWLAHADMLRLGLGKLPRSVRTRPGLGEIQHYLGTMWPIPRTELVRAGVCPMP